MADGQRLNKVAKIKQHKKSIGVFKSNMQSVKFLRNCSCWHKSKQAVNDQMNLPCPGPYMRNIERQDDGFVSRFELTVVNTEAFVCSDICNSSCLRLQN